MSDRKKWEVFFYTTGKTVSTHRWLWQAWLAWRRLGGLRAGLDYNQIGKGWL